MAGGAGGRAEKNEDSCMGQDGLRVLVVGIEPLVRQRETDARVGGTAQNSRGGTARKGVGALTDSLGAQVGGKGEDRARGKSVTNGRGKRGQDPKVSERGASRFLWGGDRGNVEVGGPMVGRVPGTWKQRREPRAGGASRRMG